MRSSENFGKQLTDDEHVLYHTRKWPDQRVLRVGLVLAALAIGGCSRGLDLAPATGRVSLDGKPVTDASVMYLPANGGPVATGSTDSQGAFELHTTNEAGALVGRHRVTISKSELQNVIDGAPGPGGAKLVWHIPERFSRAEASGLEAEIKRGESNTRHFELQSQP